MAVGSMSVYAIHKLLQRLSVEPAFRADLKRDPEAALEAVAITSEERSALLEGQVGVLNAMGVHGYLLSRLARYELFGLDQQRYVERIRQQ
jgi:hypothetical protein